MIVNFWTLIFVLLNCHPNGLCLSFHVANEIELVCRAVPLVGSTFERRRNTNLQWSKSLFGRTGRICVTKLNSTRTNVHLICRNCDTGSNKFSLSEYHCRLPNEEEEYLTNGTPKKIGNSTKYIVHFLNRTKRTDNTIICKRSNGFEWRTKLHTKYWSIFICSKRNDSIRWNRKNAPRQRIDKIVHDKTFARKRRNILGNYDNSSTFQTYSRHSNITSHQVMPSLTVQSPTVTLRSVTDVWNLCPRSLIVNCSTIFVTPGVVGTMDIAGTSQLASPTHFTTTVMLRNSTHVANASFLSSASKLASNATSRLISAQLVNSRQNATHIYDPNNGLITVTCINQGSVFTTSFHCPLVSQTSSHPPTSITTTPRQETKFKTLYIGLIAGGGVVLFIVICMAMVLLVRRYRRIQALRRTAKQISYFNRFDCSSPWDESDRFGGSKLSVFTLKNSKFDIDWDSTHDTK